ncbi:rCG63239 [Rattus norvegicus]|uniref:RCG63239 n=1 Tax=Rattus norvegicus TaxID=10116 RepID=A6JUB8_RAT|nr:rCG63239 [Rattus norvegicus]
MFMAQVCSSLKKPRKAHLAPWSWSSQEQLARVWGIKLLIWQSTRPSSTLTHLQHLCLTFKVSFRGWRDGLVVKSTDCYFEGLKFSKENQLGGSR